MGWEGCALAPSCLTDVLVPLRCLAHSLASRKHCRLAEAKRRAEEEAAAAAVREAEYKAEQAREAERQKLAQEAARKVWRLWPFVLTVVR